MITAKSECEHTPNYGGEFRVMQNGCIEGDDANMMDATVVTQFAGQITANSNVRMIADNGLNPDCPAL